MPLGLGGRDRGQGPAGPRAGGTRWGRGRALPDVAHGARLHLPLPAHGHGGGAPPPIAIAITAGGLIAARHCAAARHGRLSVGQVSAGGRISPTAPR